MKIGSFETNAECWVFVLGCFTVSFVCYGCNIFIFIEPLDKGHRHVYCQKKADRLKGQLKADKQQFRFSYYLPRGMKNHDYKSESEDCGKPVKDVNVPATKPLYSVAWNRKGNVKNFE